MPVERPSASQLIGLMLIGMVAVSASMGCDSEDGALARLTPSPRTNATGVEAAATIPDARGIAFRDVAAERRLQFEWPVQSRPLTALAAFGCGCGFFDFDQDGWQDVLLVGNPTCGLFRNESGRQFGDVSGTGGLAMPEARWTGCAVGDYDADGWLDVLVTGFHRLALFVNRGDGTFSEATVAAGLDPENHGRWGSSAGFMDLDGDSILDLVILNYVVFGPHVKQFCELKPGVLTGCQPKEYEPEFGEIRRGTDAGRFEPVDGSGMEDTHGIGLVLAFADLDADRLQDFYIGNDGKLAELMHNSGDMKFENIGLASGVAFKNMTTMVPMAAMGADWGDFDRDGRFDLTVTDFQMASAGVFRNLGNLSFTDVGVSLGIHGATRNRLGFGAKWLDFDNDGWLDICYVNGHVYDNVSDLESDTPFRQRTQLFHSRKGREFVDLVPALTSDVGRPIVGRGSATADFDNDGRMDLLIVDFEGPAMLLHNETESPHHWLTLELRSSSANRFAYGACVAARSGNGVSIGQVSPASSYLSSSDTRVHFGLGAEDHLDELTIRWPSGRDEVLKNVRGDQILRLREGLVSRDESQSGQEP